MEGSAAAVDTQEAEAAPTDTMELKGQSLKVYIEDKMVSELTDIATANLNAEHRAAISSAIRSKVRLELSYVFEGRLVEAEAAGALDLLKGHFDVVKNSLSRLGRLAEIEASEEAEKMRRVQDSIKAGGFDGIEEVGVRKFLALLVAVLEESGEGDAEKRALQDQWRRGADCAFENLDFKAQGDAALPKRMQGPTSVKTSLRRGFWSVPYAIKGALGMNPAPETLHILKNATGVYKSGRITLVLGPPGAGKSTLFHVLSGRVKTRKGKTEVTGAMMCGAHDLHTSSIPNFVSMVEQIDVHLPTLTTRETLEFAFNCRRHDLSNKALSKMPAEIQQAFGDGAIETFRKQDENTVDLFLAMLGLTRCAETVIGDANLKGVSGGEKRRVTLGEILVTKGKILLLDEISTGLDSAATMDITNSLKAMARLFHITIAVSLLQPPPETYELFDDVQLLTGGMVMYHGPREEIMPYFSSLGYVCPDTKDPADFLQEVTTNDGAKYLISDGERAEAGIPAPPSTPEEFAERFKATKWASEMQETITELKALASAREEGVIEDQTDLLAILPAFRRSPRELYKIVLHRQKTLLKRNTQFLKAHTFQMLFMGLVYGALYFQMKVDISGGNTKTALLFITMQTIGMSAFQLVPQICLQRAIYYKQKGENFFPPLAFVLGDMLSFVPIPILDIFTFGTIIYWMTNLAPQASEYFFFCLTLFVFTFWFGVFIRAICYITPDTNSAQAVGVICLVFCMITSGFTVSPNLVTSSWLVWLYWINPFAWTLRSLAQNELYSPDYEKRCPGSGSESCGLAVLKSRQFPTEEVFRWTGVLFDLGMIGVFLCVAIYALLYVQYDATNAAADVEELSDEDKDAVEMVRQNGVVNEVADGTMPPCRPMTLAWRNLVYSIEIPIDGGLKSIDILKGIKGYAKPGELTALMGSSGAGKTTLLDCLAGRKTMGTISGDIMVNGFPKNDAAFKLMIGYVEQFASLPIADTVLECLRFSTILRAPGAKTEDEVNKVVADVVRTLELGLILVNRIGTLEGGGLSFEQMKRVAIAVELVANPSILFCDEPTSGLDARAALFVMKGLKRIAQSGRTIICTIHQPSINIFRRFDNLVLMKRGGEVVFFGELGKNSTHLINYFEAQPGVVNKCPNNYNPATWMLEIIGAGVGSDGVDPQSFVGLYRESELGVSQAEECNRLCTHEVFLESDRSEPLCGDKSNVFRTSFTTQFKQLYYRSSREMWRTPSYSLIRWIFGLLIPGMLATMMPQLKLKTSVDVASVTMSIGFVAQVMSIYNLFTIIPFIYSHDPCFYREKGSGMYDPKAFVLAIVAADFPFVVFEVFIAANIMYWVVGLQATFWVWLYYFYQNCVFILAVTYLGGMFSAIASNPAGALAAGMIPVALLSSFSGLFPNPKDIPSWMIWLYYISPYRWLNEGLFTTQFLCEDSTFGETLILASTPEAGPVFMTAAQYTFGKQAPGGAGGLVECVPGGTPGTLCVGDTLNLTIVEAGWETGMYGGSMGYKYEWKWYDVIALTGIMLCCLAGHLYAISNFTHEKR